MNGAESLVRTLVACGVDTCFANPGTSEMHFVAALDTVPGMRSILGLFEGVVTGAADGYARIADKPAATLLHCGPGLANGLANMHNGRRARTMMVNCVGDHATFHRPLDAPLTADTEGWARPVSGWVRTAAASERLGQDAAAAVQAACSAPGQIATLILPSDTCWDPGGTVAAPLPVPAAAKVDPFLIAQTARILRSGAPTAIILGDRAVREAGLHLGQAIADATGADLLAHQSNTRLARGRGRPPIRRVPYATMDAVKRLERFEHLILIGATPPVAFFAHPGKPGRLSSPATQIHVVGRPENDLIDALERLAAELGVSSGAPEFVATAAERAIGAVTFEKLGQSLAALLPEDAIVIDESITASKAAFDATYDAAPHDWLQIMGGAIGAGLPLATGAAVAAPHRRVVSLEADGSAMYTLQALWTQARERLNVTTVLLSNRKYAILQGELRNVGAAAGPAAQGMMDLGNPDLDWTKLARGMGVAAERADTMERFNDLFAEANRRPGPFVIELAC